MKPSELLELESDWNCMGEPAVDGNDNPCDPEDEHALAWSIFGACIKCHVPYEGRKRLDELIKKRTNRNLMDVDMCFDVTHKFIVQALKDVGL